MARVTINAPKTPVTKGSMGIAAATVPNVCKMPGPPAPFVPTPLPNIGKSGDSPQGYSTTVKIEGQPVAIRGASFGSMGDVASQGTGGGLISSSTQGRTKFIGPGSLNVKIEGKNVQLLGDPMLNNCGPGGSPANAATMMGVLQACGLFVMVPSEDRCALCEKEHGKDKQVEESQGSKNAAKRVAAVLERDEVCREGLKKMLGVVECKCTKHYYVAHSGMVEGSVAKRFGEIVSSLGGSWHPVRAPYVDGPEGFMKGRPLSGAERDRFQKAWTSAEYRTERFSRKRTGQAYYPPGTCAAQKALRFAGEHGARRKSLTEQYFNPGRHMANEVLFADADGRSASVAFAHGGSVPPCGTCEMILPMLLCLDEGEDKCSH